MASFLLKLPDRELQAIERARGPMKRLTWVRLILRRECDAVEAAKANKRIGFHGAKPVPSDVREAFR